MKTSKFKTVLLVVLVMLCSIGGIQAQSLSISGYVTYAADGLPVVACAVVVKGSTQAVITDLNGKYTIRANKGDILVFSMLGYKTQEVKVNSEIMNVVMKNTTDLLQEIVTTRKEEKSEILPPPVLMITEDCCEMIASADMSSCYVQPQYEVISNNEEYNNLVENRFKSVLKEPLSTFSIDVDAASYSNMRRYINQGQLPPADAIRTEELVNYFSYNYSKPTGTDPVKISTETAVCPWNEKHRLVRIGIKAREIADENLSASNLVFLIDVSGSMYGPARLELVKSSLKLLVNNLRNKDRVAIVVYSGSAGEILPSTSGSDKQKIREALDKLTAGGSTAGGAGIQLAYKIARKNFIENGNNRIILCTDGDFNVGVSSKEGLESLIEKERKSGVFLTVLGYGMGNYKDNRMQVLAEKGNGNHAYIDNIQEANKVLINEFGGTIHTVAKDVKLQIEFNPSQVQTYRLIGYESRLLNKEDFNNDTKDAGEIGAGHSVTAFYEIVPVGVKGNFAGSVDELKYQKEEKKIRPVLNGSNELLTVKLRYKDPDKDTSKKIELAVTDKKTTIQSGDFNFSAAVVMFGQLLCNSDFKGDATYDKVIQLAKTGLDNDLQGYRREFLRLVEATKGLEE